MSIKDSIKVIQIKVETLKKKLADNKMSFNRFINTLGGIILKLIPTDWVNQTLII